MIDRGKGNVLGVYVDAVDYEAATDKVLTAAREQRPAFPGRQSWNARMTLLPVRHETPETLMEST